MYRVREEAKICGLFAGISNATGINVDFIRFAALVVLFVTGFFPSIVAYFVLCAVIPAKGERIGNMSKLQRKLEHKAEKFQRKAEKFDRFMRKRGDIFSLFEQRGNEVVDKIFQEIRAKMNSYDSQPQSAQTQKPLNSADNSVKPAAENIVKPAPSSSEKQNKIRDIVEQIKGLSKGILEKEKSNVIVARIIEEFKDKIIEFENYSPSLEKQYLACHEYLRENSIDELKTSIISLKEKIELSSASVKKNYLSMLEQKESRLKLLEDIKEYTEIIESKLYLILDTLQNIEASILHAELQSHLEDDNYDNLQSYISVLTENMSEMSDIFKKSKMRL